MVGLGSTEAVMLEVVVPGNPPTPNMRMGHMAAARSRAKWRKLATEAALAVKPEFWAPLERAWVECVFVVADNRSRDFDNAIAARKPLFDGLVDAGILVDDSNRVIKGLQFGFAVRPGLSQTVFVVRSFRPEY